MVIGCCSQSYSGLLRHFSLQQEQDCYGLVFLVFCYGCIFSFSFLIPFLALSFFFFKHRATLLALVTSQVAIENCPQGRIFSHFNCHVNKKQRNVICSSFKFLQNSSMVMLENRKDIELASGHSWGKNFVFSA